MLRFISKLNDDLKDQLFILCSATSRYLATITAQLMLRNVVPNSFVTPEGRMSRLGGWPNRVSFIFLNFLGKNLTIGAPIKIYRRRRGVSNLSAAAAYGGGAHVCFDSNDNNQEGLNRGQRPKTLLKALV